MREVNNLHSSQVKSKRESLRESQILAKRENQRKNNKGKGVIDHMRESQSIPITFN